MKRQRSKIDFALSLLCLGATAANGQASLPISGEYVCKASCRATDVNPSIEINGTDATCMNELGGLYHGKVLGPDSVYCFKKVGTLSKDGSLLTWDDGAVWKRP